MNKYLQNIDWPFLLSDTWKFSAVISNFYSTIYEAIRFFTPKFSNSNYNYSQ